MRRIALFVEDYAHQQVVGALVRRVAGECGVGVQLDWRSAVRGHGRVVRELDGYLRDLKGQGSHPPDLIIVATDANCDGLNERVKQISRPGGPSPMVFAVPDPHVERWLLLDGAAFRDVFGRGCDAPDLKCDRDLYKLRLIEAIHAAGITPNLGGIEFAEDIVKRMDLERATQADRSLRRFVAHLRVELRQWQA